LHQGVHDLPASLQAKRKSPLDWPDTVPDSMPLTTSYRSSAVFHPFADL
jgi:hypothetical protein